MQDSITSFSFQNLLLSNNIAEVKYWKYCYIL